MIALVTLSILSVVVIAMVAVILLTRHFIRLDRRDDRERR